MTNTGTTRITPPIEATHERRITRRWGNRYHCTTCAARGIEKEPQFMCHHCGRLYCEECAPATQGFGALFQHQELSALKARGVRRRVLDIWWPEAAHCSECVHYVPRYPLWMALWGVIAVGAAALLFLQGAGAGAITVIPIMILLTGLAVAWLWRWWDANYRQDRFFPIDGEPPIIEVDERMEAEAVLDGGKYTEALREGSPYGKVAATVRITDEDRRQLDTYEHHNHLTEYQLSQIPVTAGAVVMENVVRVTHPDMRWSAQGEWMAHPDIPAWGGQRSRRCQFTAPLAQWAALWVQGSNEPKRFEFTYLIDWWVPRNPFRWAFPVQVQAHFPEQSDRRTLVLDVVLTNSISHFTHPYIRQVTLKAGEGMPPFRLLPAEGQTMESDSQDTLTITDLRLNDQRRGTLQLRFDQPLDVSTPVWLTGTATVGTVGATFSLMEMKAYFDAFGRKARPTRTEIRSHALLDFRLNLSALPYQQRAHATVDFTLSGADAERDDVLCDYLSETTEVVYLNEQAQPIPINATHRVALPPIREVIGRFPNREDRLGIPLAYTVKLTPHHNETSVHIEVEMTDSGDPSSRDLPQQQADALVTRLRAAAKPAVRPAPEPNLLTKLRGR